MKKKFTIYAREVYITPYTYEAEDAAGALDQWDDGDDPLTEPNVDSFSHVDSFTHVEDEDGNVVYTEDGPQDPLNDLKQREERQNVKQKN